MFIPIRCNDDLPHWPFATLGLIGVATAAFFSGLGEGHDSHPWILTFASGLHPGQWLSANFLHFGYPHLIFNMVFLWAFGMTVEGRVGWWKFLLLYLGIGIVGCLLVQIWMLNYKGLSQGAGGASLAIYGVMAVALLWMPFCELECYWLCRWNFRMFAERAEVGVFWIAAWYILGDLLTSARIRFVVSTPTLHLAGAAVGTVVGLVCLKWKLVDTDGQDVFHVGRVSRYFDRFRRDGKVVPSPDAVQTQKVRRERTAKFREHVAGRNWTAAYQSLLSLHPFDERRMETSLLEPLGHGLFRLERFDDAADVYHRILTRHAHPDPLVRLKLAAVLLEVRQRPRAALRVLAPLDPDALTEFQATRLRQIRSSAARLIDTGMVEIATAD